MAKSIRMTLQPTAAPQIIVKRFPVDYLQCLVEQTGIIAGIVNQCSAERVDAVHLTDGTLSELEQQGLTQFLQVLSNLRSHLVQCYDRKDFPRTNNEMERRIRGQAGAVRARRRR